MDLRHVNMNVLFKIKVTMPLKRLMDAYCRRCGTSALEVIFMIDSERIRRDDTGLSLDLSDGDCLFVLPSALAGAMLGA